jgi:uncharacterized protein YggL (DUF469 family)
MKKRLRKKKRVGEFKVYGVPIAVKLAAGTDFDSFLDAFILDAIESNGCYVFGGGKKDRFVGFVELARVYRLFGLQLHLQGMFSCVTHA